MAGKKPQHFTQTTWFSLEGSVETARAPTEEELYDLLRNLVETSEIPPELFLRLRRLIEMQILQKPWSQHKKERVRWSFVCEGIKAKGWDAAFESASAALEGSPAAAGPDMMAKSYNKIQNELLPSGQHRPRTYKRH